MTAIENKIIIEEYFAYLGNKDFPCIAAKATVAMQQMKCMVAENLSCPRENAAILHFLYDFVDNFRNAEKSFHSAAVIFKQPEIKNEKQFDELLWKKLQDLIDLDAINYRYDKRVDADPSSPNFSFSLKEEAFFIIGLHPLSSRSARRFTYPALVFNPHIQFEKLRQEEKYERMKDVVRKRDAALSGSINPMLEDFGKSSEVYQYSGRKYDETWQCPLKINHADNENNPAT